MPIRDVDTFNLDSKAEIAANRGANGIDGVVSTALGMSVYKKVTLVIGDISFFHDMNGLIMSKLHDLDITIVCLNNCLLYTSDAADDMQCVDLGCRRIIKKKKKKNEFFFFKQKTAYFFFSSRRRHTR